MNRAKRRKLKQKLGVVVTENVVKLLDPVAGLDANRKDSFTEGTRVRINPETVTLGNRKRNKWILEHADDLFTIEYDPKWGENPTIYCLVEDESDPKWYFAHFELLRATETEGAT